MSDTAEAITLDPENADGEIISPSKRRRLKQPAPFVASAIAVTPADGKPAYWLTEFVFTDNDGTTFWTALLKLGAHDAASVKYFGPKRSATVSPLASTTGAEHEVGRFVTTAARLLGRKDAVNDMVMILAITSEPAITGFNRALMLKDIAGSEPFALEPGLIVPE